MLLHITYHKTSFALCLLAHKINRCNSFIWKIKLQNRSGDLYIYHQLFKKLLPVFIQS